MNEQALYVTAAVIMIIVAGGIVSVAMRDTIPFLVAFFVAAPIGGAITSAVYERIVINERVITDPDFRREKAILDLCRPGFVYLHVQYSPKPVCVRGYYP